MLPSITSAKPKIECKHGRFAGAVRADQAERLALADAQRKVVQDFHRPVAGAQMVDGEEVVAFDQRIERRDRRRVFGDALGLALHVVDRHDSGDIAEIARFLAAHISAPPDRRR